MRRKKVLPAPTSATSAAPEIPSTTSDTTATRSSYTISDPLSPEEEEDAGELDSTLEREETDEEANMRIAGDGGQAEHDTSKVLRLRDRAIQDMRNSGVTIPDEEARAAVNVLTKVRATQSCLCLLAGMCVSLLLLPSRLLSRACSVRPFGHLSPTSPCNRVSVRIGLPMATIKLWPDGTLRAGTPKIAF